MKVNITPTTQEADKKAKRESFKGRDITALRAQHAAANSVPALREATKVLWDVVEELRSMFLS